MSKVACSKRLCLGDVLEIISWEIPRSLEQLCVRYMQAQEASCPHLPTCISPSSREMGFDPGVFGRFDLAALVQPHLKFFVCLFVLLVLTCCCCFSDTHCCCYCLLVS